MEDASSIPLKNFLDDYGPGLAAKVTRELTVVHDPGQDKEERIETILASLAKKPFPAQAEIVKAAVKSLLGGNRAIYLTAECGTGKTLMAIAAAWVLSCLIGLRRVLVVCPPHLVPKWLQEIHDSLPQAKAINLNGKNVIRQLERVKSEPRPVRLEFSVIGRERAKTGSPWRPAVVTRRGHHYCPRCGQELLDQDGYPLPVFETNAQGRVSRKFFCRNLVAKWIWNQDTGLHEEVEAACGEPLWQPDSTRPGLRKAMPARFVKDRMKGVYDLLVVDECHQFKNESGQGYAFGALATACRYVVGLTGTLAGGYASDVFQLLFRTHPRLMLQDRLKWGNPMKFVERYGVLEKITTIKAEDGLTTKARKRTVVKAKPGISPLLLGRMLLGNSVFLRLNDCLDHLQPYQEDVVELAMAPEMAQLHDRFEEETKTALREALGRGDTSLLGAYLQALLSYPERIHQGLSVIHPHTQEKVAEGAALDGVMPKEQELISIVKMEKESNRKVLVYIQNSETTDISPRLVGMMESEGIKVKVLKSGDTERRAEIIQNWVDQGIDVLVTNPRKVEVGMDLLDFPSVVFYQVPMSTYTLRQASRRSWRIPQTRPVRVWFLTYAGTMQTRLMRLMADKLMCSLALEGELSDKGLAALSETSDSLARELARMLLEKSGEGSSLKDVWAAFRKKEVQVETVLTAKHETTLQPLAQGEIEPDRLPADIAKASVELERIGDQVVKVQFVEYVGKRRKKVTHIEVRQAELDDLLSKADHPVQAQICLF